MSKVFFYAGIVSIPLSIFIWYFAPVFNTELYAGISDDSLRIVLESAYSERWGIFVGLWAPTLLLLSHITKD